ncbi:MAG: hypothetical protein A2Z08_03550 [Deltaproteobacteria bacterium RBG_16_54_11]|nr:MAG: hypothetical protein A2Z08_03550 [Deltaproteobacteria bacterium RBG_16_54_11]
MMWQRCWMSASMPDSALFRAAAVNGTRGGTAATLWFEMHRETFSRSIWITATARNKAGGW